MCKAEENFFFNQKIENMLSSMRIKVHCILIKFYSVNASLNLELTKSQTTFPRGWTKFNSPCKIEQSLLLVLLTIRIYCCLL